MKRYLNKPLSNLDLKLLDVKFIAIDDNQLYLTQALHSVRKAKLTELPSLLFTKDQFNSQSHTHHHNHNLSSFNPNSQQTFLQDHSILSAKYNDRTTIDSINPFDRSTFTHNNRQTDLSQDHRHNNLSYDETYLDSDNNLFSHSKLHKNAHSQLHSIQDPSPKNLNLNKNNNSLNPLNNSLKLKPKDNLSFSHDQSHNQQDAQLQKYRKKIQLVKKQNSLIHQQISSLYRHKISNSNLNSDNNKQLLKKIKKIEPFKQQEPSFKPQKPFRNRQNSTSSAQMNRVWQAQNVLRKSAIPRDINDSPSLVEKKLASCPMIKQKLNFYENLAEKSPYKEELDKIHKKIISNNLHKNFEQYLVTTNKRVPEFIKKLRN